MPGTPLLKPHLYTDEAEPRLLGGVCSCGHIFFPMQTYGCERCGHAGSDLRPKALEGRGRLIASATVHFHRGARAAPFCVGAIELDEGPVVRTLIVGEANPLAGTKMAAVLALHETTDGTGPALDLRFKPLSAP